MGDVVPVLVNPGMNRRRSKLSTIERALSYAGRSPDTTTPADRDAVIALVADCVERRTERLLVVGGDGLVHLAAQAAAGTRLTLGVVPAGTGNDFARGLQISTDPAASAVTALVDAVSVDAMSVNDSRTVASVITFGFSGDVNARANRLRRPRGSLRYTIATLLELRGLRTQRLRFTLDGREVIEREAVIAAIANTGYFGGGMWIAPHADPCDGILDLCVIGPVKRLALLKVFPKVFKGRHLSHPAVSNYRAHRIEVEALDAEGAGDDAHPLAVWGDGELVGQLPIEVKVMRAALRIAGARPVIPKK